MKGRNMTRWRDPAKDPRQAPKSNLITAEGAARARVGGEAVDVVDRQAGIVYGPEGGFDGEVQA